MAKEPRPKGYPKLKNYKPSQFMLPTSHYDKKKADRAVTFIENLCHTKGKWAGAPFWLLPWQEQLIRDIFGIVKPDGNRQFRTAFVEICKKVGKSELAAAVALYLLYADNEPSAEVYGAAADRQQASIVFDVAKQMVEMSPALMKRSKLMAATKRIVNYGNAGYYQVLSAEVGGKHGFSVSGLVFDEIHTQPNRQLYDVLTKGSSDARQNPLHFIITTAGNDRHSIAFELHTKAVDILEGRRVDPTFYPVVYGLKDDEDWEDEANWYKVNPSLGYTVDIERLRDAYREAKQNPADEITFKWLRMNMWVSSTTAWIPDAIYMRGNEPIDMDALEGRDCYAGLDLSSTGDITALVLLFPPRDMDEKYIVLPFFWVPEDTLKGVGKNPRLAHAKSKNEKNISGLLNQIIDNKEAGKIGIHTFTNASSFTVGESDVKIISIEFAPNEAVMAQFFGSVIVGVNADQVERSVVARGDVVIPSVEVTELVEEVLPEDGNGTESEVTGSEDGGVATEDASEGDTSEEPKVIGNTKEQTVSVEMPVVWKEDGQVVVHFTFEFNDNIIEIHQPEETWHSGKHSIMLYYPIENLVANYRNIFNVYARATGGTVTVDTGDCLAAIMGQSMGAGEAWDGEIKIEETIKKVKVGGVLQMTAVDENITWKIDELVKRTYSDVVHGRFGIGAFAMPVER